MIRGDPTTSSPRWRAGVPVALAAVAVTGLYAVLARDHGFLYDDRQLILDEVRPRSLGDLGRAFTEPYYGALPYYRPLARLSYMIQKALWGALPFVVVNAVLAGLAVIAAFTLLRRPRFGLARTPALAAALAFAIIPVASSCVFPIAGRDTLLPSVLLVSAVTCWLADTRGWRLAACALVAAALLAKEVAVVAPLLLVLADATSNDPPRSLRARISRHAPVIAIVVACFVLRRLALAGTDPPVLARSILLPIASLGFGVQAALTPFVDLVYEPALSTWLSLPRLALALSVLAALIAATWRAERRGAPRNAAFWLGWFVVLQLPMANVFRQETLFDERYAFPAALAPLALAATVATISLAHPRRRVAWIVAGPLVFAGWIAIDVHRASTYADGLSFHTAWVRSSPESARAWNGLGVALLDAGRTDDGEAALRRALSFDPRDVEAANNLGVALLDRGRADEATAHLELAVAQSSSYAPARYNLANARAKAGRLREAEALYRDAIRLRPHYVQAWNNLGALLVRLDRNEEALAAFQRVVELDPGHVKARINRGVLLARRGRFAEAMAEYRAAIDIDPADPDAWFDLGAAAIAAGDRATADRALDEALRLRPGWSEAATLRTRLEQQAQP